MPLGYVEVRVLGSGAFGTVLEVAQLAGDAEHFALKMPSSSGHQDDVERFGREIRIQSQLDHPNIVPILDFSNDPTNPWFIAPLATGNLLNILPVVTETVAMSLYLDMLRGVSYAHRNRIIHRDIKPENVLVFDNGGSLTAKVGDFGLGRELTRKTSFLTATGIVGGTPGYAAPEQWQSLRDADSRADIYACGAVLRTILDAVCPPDGVLHKRLSYSVTTACAERPDDRYQTVDDLIRDVSLVSSRPRLHQRPIDSALDLVREAMDGDQPRESKVGELVHLLIEYCDNYPVLTSVLHRLPPNVLAVLLGNHREAMRVVIEKYVEMLDGTLAMDFALEAASLLDDIRHFSDDSRIKASALSAVVGLAARFATREFAYPALRALASENDAYALRVLAERIATDTATAHWCRENLEDLIVAPIIAEAIARSS